jgi:RNA 3'-terminal phosphate cyclase (ATP)
VLQTVLPALLLAAGESELELEGGTHNPLAPPFEFLARSFLPLLGRMGARVEAVLERPGFYPAGGGRLRVRITPPAGGRLRPLELPVRGAILRREAEALVARLPAAIGRRELAVLGRGLQLRAEELRLRLVADSAGPGNVLQAALTGEAGVTELFTAFGQRGVPAEAVARGLAAEVREYLAAPDVPVGRHLADQLLLPLALAGGGAFRTLPPTPHFESNRQVIETFLPVRITAAAESGGGVQVRVECLEERGSR